MKIVYLKKGERRPRGDKSLLIICKPGGQEMTQGAQGASITVPPADLDEFLASIKHKGAATVYVRGR